MNREELESDILGLPQLTIDCTRVFEVAVIFPAAYLN